MTKILVSLLKIPVQYAWIYVRSYIDHTMYVYICTYIKYLYTNYVDISFELPLEEELQSSGGIEFNTGRSQIYIPYTAIQHQKNTEGTYVHV